MDSPRDGSDTFVDLSIVGVDKDRTHNPDPGKALYDVYLGLSATAPAEWAECFEKAHEFPRHSMWRRAWCEGDYIVIHCPLDEVERHHLEELKKDVATANAEYRKLCGRYLREQQQEDAAFADEQRSKNEMLDNLEFD